VLVAPHPVAKIWVKVSLIPLDKESFISFSCARSMLNQASSVVENTPIKTRLDRQPQRQLRL
jgi:hypothetical protein